MCASRQINAVDFLGAASALLDGDKWLPLSRDSRPSVKPSVRGVFPTFVRDHREISVALVRRDHGVVSPDCRKIRRRERERKGGQEHGGREREARDTVAPCCCISRRNSADRINEMIAEYELRSGH